MPVVPTDFFDPLGVIGNIHQIIELSDLAIKSKTGLCHKRSGKGLPVEKVSPWIAKRVTVFSTLQK
jgi:hypothetical protein